MTSAARRDVTHANTHVLYINHTPMPRPLSEYDRELIRGILKYRRVNTALFDQEAGANCHPKINKSLSFIFKFYIIKVENVQMVKMADSV